MNSGQKFRSYLTAHRILLGMSSMIFFSAAWFVWSLPVDLKESRAEMDIAERTEAIAKAFSHSSSLFSLMCIAGSFAAYKAVKK